MIVETSSGRIPRFLEDREKLATEILCTLEPLHPLVSIRRVLFKTQFPLDVRHQAKIDRSALRVWAEGKLR